MNAIIPEKNKTIVQCLSISGTVWNILAKNGTYNIEQRSPIEIKTAPTKYGLVNNFISKIECLSDLHSKTWKS